LTDAEAKVISSRIGWNGTMGRFTGVLWVGVMYQDVSQTLDLPLDIGDKHPAGDHRPGDAGKI
jgi:hypothetical protein